MLDKTLTNMNQEITMVIIPMCEKARSVAYSFNFDREENKTNGLYIKFMSKYSPLQIGDKLNNKEIIDIRAIAVQDIRLKDWLKLIPNDGKKLSMSKSDFYKENNVDRNDYIFLVEVK